MNLNFENNSCENSNVDGGSSSSTSAKAVGIDSIAFSTSRYFLSLKTFAKHRNVDYLKYCEGIGQTKMSVFPPNEDIVTIAVDAANKALEKIDVNDRSAIDLLIFATESSFDLSKSAGIYVHHFLNLKPECRVFDVKQACYSATAALRMAENHVRCHSGSKALVIASDIVRYPPQSSGEATQGGAAIAMIISENPRVAQLEPFSGINTLDIADFWRPATENEAKFDGKLSAHTYLKSLDSCLKKYSVEIQKNIADITDKDNNKENATIDYSCFHAPFCKMAIKAARQSFPGRDMGLKESLLYNALIGNSCSASLYIGLISLLDNSNQNLSGARVGMYSYGSGSIAEYFSLRIPAEYKSMLNANENAKMLEERGEISWEEYEELGNGLSLNETQNLKNCRYKVRGQISLVQIKDGYRQYERTL